HRGTGAANANGRAAWAASARPCEEEPAVARAGRITSRPALPRSLFPASLQVRRDDLALDLGGPLDHLEDLRVAQPLLHGVVAHDPGAAEDLDCVGRDAHSRV